MPGPYPKALRERVVNAYNNGEGTYEELAERFQIGRATVDNWLKLARRTGSVAPRPMGGARHPRKVDEAGEELVRELLGVMPDSTLGELARAMKEERGVDVHVTTMGRCLARMGYTKKKGH